jgi:transposase
MTATLPRHSTKTGGFLYLAFELGWTEWKLAFGTGPAQAARLRCIGARDLDALQQELARAKARFGLPHDAPVRCCYEAGRDGFWLARWLAQRGIDNVVVDASSIEVNRRARRAKTDRLDAAKLLGMLLRYHQGERGVWSVVRVPGVEDEDRRQPHRDLLELKADRTRHVNRIKGLLAGSGLACEVDADFPQRLGGLRTWDGQAVPARLRQRLLREHERWRLVDGQIRELENARVRTIRKGDEPDLEQVRKLLTLRGLGPCTSWLLVRELFGWRDIANRRQLAALAGLTPTPYQSGDSEREQGISKAGNRRVRYALVELAWGWLRWQPHSRLSAWYNERFGRGGSRVRKVGIVALARKLLVALWRYLREGAVPEGAEVVSWQKKLNGREPAAARRPRWGGAAGGAAIKTKTEG